MCATKRGERLIELGTPILPSVSLLLRANEAIDYQCCCIAVIEVDHEAVKPMSLPYTTDYWW